MSPPPCSSDNTLFPTPYSTDYIVLPTSGDNTQQEQQNLYGIYYKDDYDYLQHLRSVDYSSTRLELWLDHVSYV